MKQTLNPELVNGTPARDPKSRYVEHRVTLRDPKNIDPYKESGIGSKEIEIIHESDADLAAFKQRMREAEAALSKHSWRDQGREPHVILTRDCFGLDGPVRLLIYSDKPFASNAST